MSARILVVEDDGDLAYLISRNLEVEGYSVRCAGDGQIAMDAIHAARPDLVVLDLMLPKKDGSEVLRDLRQITPWIPVIILTARSGVSDRVLGLKLGADDYVTKPFEMVELLARVEAVLRRTHDEHMPETLDLGDLHLDFVRFQASREGQLITLSTREFRILQVFAKHQGMPLSRKELLRFAWGEEEAVAVRTVDAHIKNLRRKIEPDPVHPRWLLTVHGEGYLLVADPLGQ